MKNPLLILALALLPTSAHAGNYQPVYTAGLTDRSTASLGTSSTQLVAANAQRKYLIIENVGTVNIGCSYTTAVIGGAGTVTLVPNGSWTFEGNFIYTGAIKCIAASGSSNVVTIFEGQ